MGWDPLTGWVKPAWHALEDAAGAGESGYERGGSLQRGPQKAPIPGVTPGPPETKEASSGGGGNKNGGKKNKGGGGGGNGSGYRGLKGHPVDYLTSLFPGMKRADARNMLDDYIAQKNLPEGLQEFTDQYQANEVDPLATQLFYSQTVAPYLKEQTDQMIKQADAGQQYMANVLNTVNLDPAYKKFLSASIPGTLNAQVSANLAGQGAAMAAPALDQLFNRMQKDIEAKDALRIQKQIEASGGSKAAAGNLFT